MMTEHRISRQALLLVPGGFALLAGLDAALVLLGLRAPIATARLTGVHGVLLAHAPVILPAVLRRPLPYTPAMYGPVALLHLSLLLRLAVGDARGAHWAAQAGGVLNIVAVLGFIGVAGCSAIRAACRVPA